MEHILHPQDGYPFALALRIDYRLDPDGLTVQTTATNVGAVECPYGSRLSDLERWRKGPGEPLGKGLRLALRRVAEIHEVGIDGSRARARARARPLVPGRRLADFARYGMAAKAPRLRRHPPARRVATLLGTLAPV